MMSEEVVKYRGSDPEAGPEQIDSSREARDNQIRSRAHSSASLQATAQDEVDGERGNLTAPMNESQLDQSSAADADVQHFLTILAQAMRTAASRHGTDRKA
jgi:hypothetical protein